MDLKILRVLQEDSSLSVTEVAQRVGLSTSPCWKRINKLQVDGIILRHEAVLDAAKLGPGLTVFMMIKTGEHSGPWLEKFLKKLCRRFKNFTEWQARLITSKNSCRGHATV